MRTRAPRKVWRSRSVDTYHQALREGRCAVKGCVVRLAGHPRCRACTILVGPGHLEGEVVYGSGGLCTTCYSYLAPGRTGEGFMRGF